MKNEEKKSSSFVSPLAIIAFGLVIVAIVTFALVVANEKPQKPQPEPETPKPVTSVPQKEPPVVATENKSVDFKMPPFHTSVENVTLPPIKDPSTVDPAAKASYVVAQNDPQLIAQLPCFCYCERFGHTSLHDCFVSDHAETCDICMKEALHADQLSKQGMSPVEIRDTIVAEFHPRESDHSGHDHD